MSRKQGSQGGRIGGPDSVRDLRVRRQGQRDSLKSGDSLGAGLQLDRKGRIAIKQLPPLDPDDPNALRYLIQYLQASGLMET